MRIYLRLGIFSLALITISPGAWAGGGAGDCRQDPSGTLKTLENGRDPDARSKAGACLMRYQLGRADVARAVLKIVRNSSEDILLREDLISAFGEASLRKQIRVEGKMAPEMGAQEKAAVDRTVASAHGLLDLTRAVKSMQDTVAVCPLESELFRALSEIALDDASHVLLRAAAVDAMEKASKRVSESGVYDERELRLVHETLKVVAARDDNSSFYSGAALAYGRLVEASLPGFPRASSASTRMLSSVKASSAK